MLLATITDGDIRRWILKGGDLRAEVKRAANYNPKCLQEGQAHLASSIMKEYGIDVIPIVAKNYELRTPGPYDGGRIGD